MRPPPPCTWSLERGWLTPEHERDCSEASCSGCRPCPKTHCAMRGRCPNHVEEAVGIITCPGCIGRTRSDIAAIVDHYATAMPEEAVEAGVDSEAFNLLGPAASLEQIHAHRLLADAQRGWCEFPRPDDPHHPYLVLGKWDLALRETYGPQTDLFITVTRAADLLTGLLAGPFPHTREFEEFASDIATCRAHLEDVAHDSRKPEVGRPCPTCAAEHGKGPRLRKRYALHVGLKRGQVCTEVKCKTCDGHFDTWHCPDVPGHWWSEEDYRNRVDLDYIEHADALPAKELAERIGVPLSTLRKWTARTWDAKADEWREPRLISRRRGPDGRKVYRVKDALGLAERGA